MLGILIVLWWVVATFAAVVLTSLMVAGTAAIVLALRDRSARTRVAGGAPPGRATFIVRRRLVLALAACTATWLGLEALGGAFLLWNRPGRIPPLSFELPASPSGEVSVVAIGGSTTLGAPYHARLSFAHIVGWRLAAMFPDLRITVDNLAFGGATIDDMYEKLRGLTTRPDVLIVYTGHNEFLRYPPDREAGTPYYGAAVPSLLARAIAAQIERLGAHEGPQWKGRRRRFDRPVCTAAEREYIYGRFAALLERILQAARVAGSLAIVFEPASNESGFAPNRSVLPEEMPVHVRHHLERLYGRLDLSGLRPRAARRLLQEARRLAPAFAETWFRLGRWYETAGRAAPARSCYRRARDLDGFPVRATSQIISSTRAAAARQGAVLLEAEEIMAATAGSRILGDDVIHDNCHPNLATHVALANAVLHELRRRAIPQAWPGADGRTGTAETAHYATVAAVAERFGMDRESWIRLCEEEAGFYEYLGAYTYAREPRVARGRAYRAAASRLRDGTAPSAAGIPAMEVPRFWR